LDGCNFLENFSEFCHKPESRIVNMGMNENSSQAGEVQHDVIDVAVVGGGIGGLATAQMLRRAGINVGVFDAAPPGGRARSHERGGFLFNLGPRALYLGGAGQVVLDRLGVRRSGGKPKISATKLLSNSQLISAPTSPLGFFTTPALGTKGKAQIGKLMGSLPRRKPVELASLSVEGWLAGEGLGSDAAAMMRSLIRLGTYCEELDRLSADAAIVALQSSAKGVQYLDGGWQSIVDQLVVGLTVHHVGVASVTSDDSTAELMLRNEQTIRARMVVVAVNSPTSAEALLGTTFSPYGPASNVSCLTIGAAAPPTHRIVLGLDEAVYLSTHCPPAKLANGDAAVIHLMRYQRSDDTMEPNASRAQLESLVRLAGIPDSNVAESEYLHSMAACSAIPTAATGGMAGRVASDTSAHSNVFLVGDYVGPTGTLVDTTLSSAAVSADTIISRLPR
jgi:hypothetical protein